MRRPAGRVRARAPARRFPLERCSHVRPRSTPDDCCWYGSYRVPINNYGGDAFSVSLFSQTIDNVHRGTLYLAGIVTAAVFLLGLRLITAGIARSRRRRLERKRAANETRGTTQELKAENERLAKKLEEERKARESAQTSAYPSEGESARTGHADQPRHADRGEQSDRGELSDRGEYSDRGEHSDEAQGAESEGAARAFPSLSDSRAPRAVKPFVLSGLRHARLGGD